MWSADYRLMVIRKDDLYIWPRDDSEWAWGQQHKFTFYERDHHGLNDEYEEYLFSSRRVTHR